MWRQFARPFAEPCGCSGAVSKPGGDAAGHDALHSAGVEGPEDSGARSKLPQPSQEEETLMCLLQHCICVSRPCEILGDVNAEELKAGHPLHRCLVDGDGGVFSAVSCNPPHNWVGVWYHYFLQSCFIAESTLFQNVLILQNFYWYWILLNQHQADTKWIMKLLYAVKFLIA